MNVLLEVDSEQLIWELQNRGYNTDLIFGRPDVELILEQMDESMETHTIDNIVRGVNTEYFGEQLNEELSYIVKEYIQRRNETGDKKR
jgi:hypothetical protein